MDIRIGVSETPKEITIELSDDTDLKKLKDIDAALSGEVVFWLTGQRQAREYRQAK